MHLPVKLEVEPLRLRGPLFEDAVVIYKVDQLFSDRVEIKSVIPMILSEKLEWISQFFH